MILALFRILRKGSNRSDDQVSWLNITPNFNFQKISHNHKFKIDISYSVNQVY